jgi:DNA-binding transcriptional MerR regulator
VKVADEEMTMETLVGTLQVSPATLRRILNDYQEVLGDVRAEHLSPDLVPILQTILRLRAEGVRRRDILALLRAEREHGDPIQGKLEEIREALMRAEEARLEDRDRLLTALMRTQQELAHLRDELLLTRSRRDRKRHWLFGSGR